MDSFQSMLKNHKFYTFFSETAVERLIEQTTVRSYNRGDIIFNQGDKADGLYVILRGDVGLMIENEESHEESVDLGRVHAGEFFGEFGVLDGKPRSAGAVVCSPDALLGHVPLSAVSETLRMPHENSAMKLSAYVLEKFRQTNARYVTEQLRKERMAVVGSMTGALVHDFKNPFTVINICAELIQMNAAGNEFITDQCNIIQEQIERSCSMADDVLDFVRGQIRLDRAFHPVSTFVERFERLNAHYLSGNDVHWESDYEDIEWTVDQKKMLRVIQNLVNNAVESFKGRRDGAIKLSIKKKNSEILLSITDNGCGIPEEVKERLFQSFVTHGKKAGTGLGLAIVKSIVEAHGGSIVCESEQGKGTSFIIRLPD